MNKLSKRLWLATLPAASLLAAGAALAAPPAADHNPDMPAVVTDKTPTPTVPAAGHNSFTEKQANMRLQAKGYTQISPLIADKNGVWHGTAMMNGVKKRVAVDYQGNVIAE